MATEKMKAATFPDTQSLIEHLSTRLIENVLTRKREKIRRDLKRRKKQFLIRLMAIIFGVSFGALAYYAGLRSAISQKEKFEIAVHEHNAKREPVYDPNAVADYALESAGAEIYGKPDAHKYKFWEVDFFSFRIPFGVPSSTVECERAILQTSKNPGECWAFAGNHAAIKIKLSHTIIPEAITIDHIERNISPTGSVNSAPRHFSVFALEEEDLTNKELLGHFEFKKNGHSTQTFSLERTMGYPTRIIEFQFHSNHGNPKYTCVYKVRVHGTVFKL